MATQNVTPTGSTAPSASVTLTDAAVARVRTLLEQGKVPAEGGLRLAVQGGGCSGLSYAVRFDSRQTDKDKVFTYEGGVRVFVDPKSLIYLAGMVVDYKNELMQQGFVFANPNAQKSCGCGSSFSS
jgi:iron-sulfur cluster assembly protein